MKHQNDELDAKLATPAQEAVREVVRSLPDETVSLAWRSTLNERVLEAAQTQRRKARIAWFMRPALGLALAGALALVVVLREPIGQPRATVRQPGVEAALIAAHEDATRYIDVTGSGLSPMEVTFGASQKPSTSVDWTEVDVESL